jgi:peptidylprolyl isomerase
MKPGLLLNLTLVLALAAPLALAKPKAPPAAPPAPSAPTDADWRTPDPDNILIIETTKGRILVELNPAAAPMTVTRIKQLARDKVYDGRTFFRVLDNFMDQTGDPLDSGAGQSSLPNIGPEFTFKRGPDTPIVVLGRQGGQEQGLLGSLPVIGQPLDLGLLTVDHKVNAWGAYCAGTLGMARSDDPESENSQFFLMRTNAESADHGTHPLDAQYTAFGRVIVGQEVVDAIKIGTGQEGQVDPPQDKMLSVTVLADIPEGSRPKVRVIDPASAWMKGEAAREQADQGPDYSVCDLHVPARVD